MCGLAGLLLARDTTAPPDLAARLERMTAALRHRGPDDRGTWVSSRAALGHRRLAIIDLSAAGHQPMATDGGSVQVAFNGEIYNFRELRAELERKGCDFVSASDTEVILHGWQQWGRGVFARLRGMFAIALWDARAGQLVLARDRVGKKPLYYAWCDGTFLFGSEHKALLAWPGMQREPDLEAIHHYLSLQYVPAPWSAFRGIRKVPKASYMVIDLDGRTVTDQYWTLPSPALARERPIAELKAELEPLLDEAVRLRMISDVPLGAFLSGGVDSSSVVAMMARHSSGPVKTFCIGFEEADFDERRYARMVAERYATDHHEMMVRPDALGVLPRIVWHYGEPYADSSAVPTYYVAEIARRHVTVALNGDGGDESFLGYHRYSECLKTEWVSRIPRPLRQLAGRVAASMSPKLDGFRPTRVARRLLGYASEKDARRYAPSMAYFFDHDKVAGYGERLRPFLVSSSFDLLDPYFANAPSFVAGAARADIETYLPDDLLVKVDIASMAHALEARSPLLDHVLMEWAAGIPAHQKMAGGETKAILKAAMEPHLPHEVLYRPKMGFGVPIERWLRNELREFAYDTLTSRAATDRGLFRPEYVRQLLDEHSSGARLHHTRLWALLMLELWFRMWIDPAAVPLQPPAEPALVVVE
jgi:asparagine synthase (glutamine-hydrolysing)